MVAMVTRLLPWQSVVTMAKRDACSAECPKGSICHATRGRCSTPNVVEINLIPLEDNNHDPILINTNPPTFDQ